MKLPNLRLYETQATASMVLGILGVLCVIMLSYFVLKGFNSEQMSITYDPQGARGQLRRPLVFGAGGAAGLVGMGAGVLGFNSLGQRRNTKQLRSWSGMSCGALSVALALVLMFAWIQLSQPMIKAKEMVL